MSNAISTITSSALEGDHVKGFVTSYAKCWEHYEGYMQDPSNTIQSFIEECQEEAEEQGLDLHLPALKTFKNKTAKLKQAGVIPERLKSDNPEAVRQRKHRASVTKAQIGPMSHSQASTSLSPETDDCNTQQQDTNPVVDLLGFQPSDGFQSQRPEVSAILPGMVSDSEDNTESEGTVSSMATFKQQQVDADWNEACKHLSALKQFTDKYFDPKDGLSERRYEQMWYECSVLATFCHMRFSNQREEDERSARQITRVILGDEDSYLLEEGA